jgi:bacteriocin-like protein
MAEWSARSQKEKTTMQDMEQTNPEILELTDAELETISGGNIFGDIGRWIVRHLQGPGDHRRPTDQP